MRAFIFSLDAFVSFTLALIAIYSLIFFASVPSSYYYVLTQAHYLSRDVLLSASTSECLLDYGDCPVTGSVLENIIMQQDIALRDGIIRKTMGGMVPNQFGYELEVSSDRGDTWSSLYDTATHPTDPHAKESKKLRVSSQVISFGYSGQVNKLQNSPYNYLTCNGEGQLGPEGDTFIDWGLITCGEYTINGQSVVLGNLHPRDILGGDIVPSSDVRLVRFTVFI